MRRLIGCLAAAMAWFASAPGAGAAEVRTLFTIDDPRLTELSGIARGIASPEVFYVHNDSGDSARFFALDASSGRVLAEYHVPGAQNVDWEDLAVAPDAAGTPSVWLADIGDNDAVRSDVTIYRVDEPTVHPAAGAITTARPDVWRLRYPQGPANAESLAVAPDGRAYVVTKRADGRSGVFAVPATPSPTPRTMRRLATITLRAQPSLVPGYLQREATGAALSRDGSRFVVRTYTDAYLWPVAHGDLAAALTHRPVRITLPLQPQGEGVCFDGARLVLDSEQRDSAVLAVPLPAAVAPTMRSSASAAPPPATGSTTAPASAVATASTSQTDDDSGDDKPALALRLGIGAIVLIAIIALFVRRYGRRQG